MAGAGEQNHVQVIPLDGAVAVDIHEVLPRHGAPVAHNLLLDVVHGKGFLQQGVVQQVQLASGQVVGSAPIGVHLFQHFLRDKGCFSRQVVSCILFPLSGCILSRERPARVTRKRSHGLRSLIL